VLVPDEYVEEAAIAQAMELSKAEEEAKSVTLYDAHSMMIQSKYVTVCEKMTISRRFFTVSSQERHKMSHLLVHAWTGRRAHGHGGRPHNLPATSTTASPMQRGIVRWCRLLHSSTCHRRLRRSASHKQRTTCRRNCSRCRNCSTTGR
jgi:hypothetical protein